jgi:glycosyltransferase involved in cell wall biosynthesis
VVAARIAHLSFSRTGGAGGVASRLANLQRQRGHDAYVVSAISGSLRDAPLTQPRHTAAAVWDERMVRAGGFAAPISLARDSLQVNIADQLAGADIIHVHWPNGLIALDQLAHIAGTRPVVWTLHDMNAFTAVCHYSLGCRGFTSGCSQCPAVRNAFHHSTTRHLASKRSALSAFHDLRIVTPSAWLAKEAAASDALFGYPATTIPNPLDEVHEPPLSYEEARTQLGISGSVTTVFALSASHLGDPLKAVATATSAFSEAFAGREDVQLLVTGRGSLPHHPQIRQMGYVSSDISRTIFAASDYLLVPSLAENQPLVIAEAQAQGASLIGRDVTGVPEHLDIDPTGRLFDSDESLASVLTDASLTLPSPAQREMLAQKAWEKFSAERAMNAYERVYGLS